MKWFLFTLIDDILKDVRIEALKYTPDADSNFRKCNYCGEIWTKVEGCEGWTNCGNRPYTGADIKLSDREYHDGIAKLLNLQKEDSEWFGSICSGDKTGVMACFEFNWDQEKQELIVKKLSEQQRKLYFRINRQTKGVGCGRRIEWNALTPVPPPSDFHFDMGNTKDIGPLPQVATGKWNQHYNNKRQQLTPLKIETGKY